LHYQLTVPTDQARRGPLVVFRGPVFSVERAQVRLSNGRTARYDVVRHRGSVVILAQPTPAEIVLVRQYRYAIDRWIWELPAGSLDAGEAPADAARRECVEETGWRPRVVERLTELYPTPGFCDERMTFYRCTELRRPARRVAGDPDEQIEPRVFTLAEARALVRRGEIVDMKTVVGLSLARRGR
jgi:ADP-ribose pyrophosphatase